MQQTGSNGNMGCFQALVSFGGLLLKSLFTVVAFVFIGIYHSFRWWFGKIKTAPTPRARLLWIGGGVSVLAVLALIGANQPERLPATGRPTQAIAGVADSGPTLEATAARLATAQASDPTASPTRVPLNRTADLPTAVMPTDAPPTTVPPTPAPPTAAPQAAAPQAAASPTAVAPSEPTGLMTSAPGTSAKIAAQCTGSAMPGAVPNAPIRIIDLDKALERVTLQNVAADRVDVTGWAICSATGNQLHAVLGGSLAPGEVVVVATRADANIWNNDDPDPAFLVDAAGNIAAYLPD